VLITGWNTYGSKTSELFMKLIYDTNSEGHGIQSIGGKAYHLWRLRSLGLNIPKWVVIPQESLNELLPENIKNGSPENILSFIESCEIPNSILNEIREYFSENTDFAVRSSAVDEDG